MMIDVVTQYANAGQCRSCFDEELAILPSDTGCRMPQPRYVGPKYWRAERKIIVCMMNPGVGRSVEESFEEMLTRFYRGDLQWASLNDYMFKCQTKWGGGMYNRMIQNHLQLKLEDIALMNIALCPMIDKNQQAAYPLTALQNCFRKHTYHIMKALEPDVVLLSGSSIHGFKAWIEDHVGCKVVLGPHYASRLRLRELQETYMSIREQLQS